MKKCSICGVSEETHRIIKLRCNNIYYCGKHREQLTKYGKITDESKPELKDIIYCSVCGENSINTEVYKNTKYGKPLCKRHSIQYGRYGDFIERTIREPNEYILYEDFCEIIVYDKNGKEKNRTKVDLEDVEKLKQYKIYEKNGYFRASLKGQNGKKMFIHRIIMNTKEKVDHINHDTSDNRKYNLRATTQQQNSFNIDKGIHKGIIYKESSNKWYAQIMLNYKGIWLGIYDTIEQATIARFIGDILLFSDFRHKDHDLEKIKIYNILSDTIKKEIVENVEKFLNKKKVKYNIENFYEYINKNKEE